MNSFNHYAYGAVGAWMYAVIGGIDLDPEQPGYKHILMRPQPGGGLTHARAELHSMYGLIRSEWTVQNQVLTGKLRSPRIRLQQFMCLRRMYPTSLKTGTLSKKHKG